MKKVFDWWCENTPVLGGFVKFTAECIKDYNDYKEISKNKPLAPPLKDCYCTNYFKAPHSKSDCAKPYKPPTNQECGGFP
jgi:hypothetical protein